MEISAMFGKRQNRAFVRLTSNASCFGVSGIRVRRLAFQSERLQLTRVNLQRIR
jgi:hypothetical protein